MVFVGHAWGQNFEVGAVKEIEKKIGYVFQKKELLAHALTHRSYAKINNERLEFLGDSILNFIVAELLFQRFPTAVEGQLSRLRASLVRGETLAAIAQAIDLGPHILLGPGEMRSGGEHRLSILADALEAVIAAIYLDAGLEVCREKIHTWFLEKIKEVSLDNINKDPKTQLQELLQSKQLALPTYELISVSGKEHAQVFIVECRVAILKESVKGLSSSRRRAEQSAAENTLMELKKHGY